MSVGLVAAPGQPTAESAHAIPANSPATSSALRARQVIDAYSAAVHGPFEMDDVVKTVVERDRVQLGGADEWRSALDAALADGIHDGAYLMVRGAIIAAEWIRGEGGEGRLGDAMLAVALAVSTAGRAVRFAEILLPLSQIQGAGVGKALRDELTGSLRTLVRTGALQSVGSVRGESAAGRHLLVPRIFGGTAQAWRPSKPLTFLEYVAAMFRTTLAASAGTATVTTSALRECMRGDSDAIGPIAASRYGADLGDPMTVVLALQKLAAGRTPLIAAVPGRRACWRLAETAEASEPSHDSLTPHAAHRRLALVPSPAVQSTYACDTDRMVVAAQRAAVRAAHAGITAHDVEAEIALDPKIRPTGRLRVPALLSDLSRDAIDDGHGRRTARKARPLRRLGITKGRAVYWVAPPAVAADEATRIKWQGALPFDDATRRFHADSVRDAFDRGDFARRAVEIERALSRSVALGRARQLEAELLPLHARAQSAADNVTLESEHAAAATATLDLIANTLDTVRGWWRFRADKTPSIGSVEPARVYTANELRDAIAPFSDVAAAFSTDGAVKSHYWRAIRRLPNPAFTNRRAASRHHAHEFYFDACDAHLYIASQWGGPFTHLMSLEARDELGDLRDVRYLIAGLADDQPRTRRRVLGALAYLGGEAAAVAVERRARSDEDPTVRECALWAVGMLRREAADPLLLEAETSDPSRPVREAAKRFRTIGAHWWYRV